jgi:hypothetical protein
MLYQAQNVLVMHPEKKQGSNTHSGNAKQVMTSKALSHSHRGIAPSPGKGAGRWENLP